MTYSVLLMPGLAFVLGTVVFVYLWRTVPVAKKDAPANVPERHQAASILDFSGASQTATYANTRPIYASPAERAD